MNETRDFEREVAAWVVAQRDATPPARALDQTLTATSQQRPLPRWLALLKEPPMRITSRVAVGSPTARLATIAIATILLAVLGAGAVVAGASYLAGPGTLIVDPTDPDAHQTIAAAVDAAEDGDTILVRPGVYPEAVTITEDITLDGDGVTPGDVVIEMTDQSATYTYWFGERPYGVVIDESDAVVRDLTVRMVSLAVAGTAFTAKGGRPIIDNVVAEHAVDIDSNGASVYLHGDAVATVKDSTLGGWVFIEEQSDATIVNNDVGRAIVIAHASGGGSVDVTSAVRLNRARGIAAGSHVLIEGNHVEGPSDGAVDWRGIAIDANADDWIIRDNTVTGNAVGIRIGSGSTGTIEGNDLVDNSMGISLTSSDATLQGNGVRGGNVGIMLTGGAAALVDNTVEGSGTGLSVGFGAVPTLSGNALCMNERNLVVLDGVDPPATEGNEICPDGLATSE